MTWKTHLAAFISYIPLEMYAYLIFIFVNVFTPTMNNKQHCWKGVQAPTWTHTITFSLVNTECHIWSVPPSFGVRRMESPQTLLVFVDGRKCVPVVPKILISSTTTCYIPTMKLFPSHPFQRKQSLESA